MRRFGPSLLKIGLGLEVLRTMKAKKGDEGKMNVKKTKNQAQSQFVIVPSPSWKVLTKNSKEKRLRKDEHKEN